MGDVASLSGPWRRARRRRGIFVVSQPDGRSPAPGAGRRSRARL